MPVEDAHLGADVLITADLRGVASHGVSNILQRYVGFFKDGLVNLNRNGVFYENRRLLPVSTAMADWGL